MVTVTDTGTNTTTVVKSNASGAYVATPLRIGNYSVSVESQGFKTETRNGIVLQVQDRLRVDFALQVGSVHEQVVVDSAPPMLQLDSSELGQVIASQQIQDLPLNGRDYTQLVSLTSGVIKIKEGSSLTGTSTASNGNAGGSFAVNGTRGMLNNFVLDGVDNNSNDNGGNVLKTNVDAIAEFRVETSNYSAEFGRSGGAVINATIKSGGNSLHGSAFEFARNSALDARQYFEQPGSDKAPYSQNQFGGTIGGPILRNKLFYFVDYQGSAFQLLRLTSLLFLSPPRSMATSATTATSFMILQPPFLTRAALSSLATHSRAISFRLTGSIRLPITWLSSFLRPTCLVQRAVTTTSSRCSQKSDRPGGCAGRLYALAKSVGVCPLLPEPGQCVAGDSIARPGGWQQGRRGSRHGPNAWPRPRTYLHVQSDHGQ